MLMLKRKEKKKQTLESLVLQMISHFDEYVVGCLFANVFVFVSECKCKCLNKC